MLRVFRTCTTLVTPKSRSSANLLHSSSETLAKGAKRGHSYRWKLGTTASLWMLLGLLNICFWLHSEGKRFFEKWEKKITTQFSKPKLSFKRRSSRCPSCHQLRAHDLRGSTKNECAHKAAIFWQLCFHVLQGAWSTTHRNPKKHTSTSALRQCLGKWAHEGRAGSSHHLHSTMLPSKH